MDILDRYLDETLLTEQEKAKVQQIVNNYRKVDMDLFVQLAEVPNPYYHMRLPPFEKRKNKMEGFEEAYKRLNMR